MCPERRGEKRQKVGGLRNLFNLGWIRRTISLPGQFCEFQLCRCYLLATGKQRSQLCSIQLAQATKVLFAGKRTNTDQSQLCASRILLRKPVQQVKQICLAEKIMLKPEHYFLMLCKR